MCVCVYTHTHMYTHTHAQATLQVANLAEDLIQYREGLDKLWPMSCVSHVDASQVSFDTN